MDNITKEITIADFSKITKEIKNISDLNLSIEKLSKENTTSLLETILGGALTLGASDIHLEPEEQKAKIRLRIDGLLQDIAEINKEIYQALLSRIKLTSGLKLNIDDRPQDGRFSILLPPQDPIEIRCSSLPAENGETIVLRILNPKSLIEIEALGLRKDLLETFQKEIKKPNGMIIVTGPTGSGKTTTLYAILKKIQRPEIKTITIEDPIEYHLAGISQTQVRPGEDYNFASGLRSIVRQDPDVILVGEIRDLETADIALQAALTGHLVLTTLHTNDAAGTIARLISLGVNPANIGPAINIAIAQRLVRKVCPKCGSQRKISDKELENLKEELKNLPVDIKPKLDANLKVPQIKGCPYCSSTGYKGRLGIFETFSIDDEMEKFILTNPSIAALKEEAIRKGMVTIKQDGLLKVLAGVTTFEEVERVAGE
jgi:type II secretory ATPase GspE/PulE/Tfp pilus assembly ATPase PilB-like protein